MMRTTLETAFCILLTSACAATQPETPISQAPTSASSSLLSKELAYPDVKIRYTRLLDPQCAKAAGDVLPEAEMSEVEARLEEFQLG